MHQDNYKIQDDMEYLLVYLASYDPDTMYFGQAMNQLECKEFLSVEIREVNSHCECKHWKLLPYAKVSKGQPILDSIWAMKRKRDIVTRQVYKRK